MKRKNYLAMSISLLLLFVGGWQYAASSENNAPVQKSLIASGDSGEDKEAAIEKYQRALLLHPTEVGVWEPLGKLLQSTGRLDEAISCYQKVAALDPKQPLVWRDLGIAYLSNQQWAEGKKCLERALQIDPIKKALDFEIGLAAFNLRQYDEALRLLSLAAQNNPKHPQINQALGYIYMEREQYQKAIDHLEIALQSAEDQATLYNNLGYCIHLCDFSRWKEAVYCFERAIELQVGNYAAYNNLGCLRREIGQWQEAVTCYEEAIKFNPCDAELRCNLGLVLWDMDRYDEAEKALLKAIELQPLHQKALSKLGMVYQAQNKKELSLATFKQISPQSEEYPQALASLYAEFRQLCDWESAQAIEGDLDRSTRKALEAHELSKETPFNNLYRCMDPLLNQQVAQNWSSYFKSKLLSPPFCPVAKPKEKLTIGYLSCDFFDHATAHLMAGLFRLHDKEKFTIIAYSYGIDDGSEYRKQIESDCSQFVDISSLSDAQAAQRLFDDKVDILVDLKGFTRSMRPAIAMYRPAPVQIAYLGFPGSSGSDCFDYILTDRLVTPESEQPYYDEQFLYMSSCYQVNDDHQKISSRPMTRLELGLPEKGFIFASFNDPYKVDAQVFNSWMNLLKKVPDSVLWLYCGRERDKLLVRKQLDQNAVAQGVDPRRILLAGRMSKPDHLRRLQLVDLALDTRTYNGHTTTSDALWAGVPVVAIKGTHFASRVSSSLLSAVGMPELITHSLPEYEALAVSLATHPSELSRLREKIKAQLPSAPLFDTERFTRELESHYRQIYDKKVQQEKGVS